MSGPTLVIFGVLVVVALVCALGIGVLDVVVRARSGHRRKWRG